MAELQKEDIEKLVAGIGIPPQPHIVLAIMDEKGRDDPDLTAITDLISRDVAISATLIKTVNSPFYGLSQKINSISQAVSILGLKNLSTLVTSLALRTTLAVGVERFWDDSARTAAIAAWCAQRVGLSKDDCFLFGLFRDAGIPLMMRKHRDYKDALAIANMDAGRAFTEGEEQRYGVSHATVGFYLAHSWGLADHLCEAVQRHHELDLFNSNANIGVKQLVAVCNLATYLSRSVNRGEPDLEWAKFGRQSLACLLLSEEDLAEIEQEVGSMLLESGF